MDFNDTPEEAAFRAEARAFLEKHLKPKGSAPASRDRVNMLEKAKAWQKTKAENKFAQITWPEEWGGRGGTAMQNVIWPGRSLSASGAFRGRRAPQRGRRLLRVYR